MLLLMYALLIALIYLAFISLGLPDSLLGAAWPVMQTDFAVPLSYAGALAMIIALGTIVSSLASARLTGLFGTARVTAFSVLISAIAILGFAFADSFWMLCLLAVPYGLSAGAVDAALNHYVAVNYPARHMSWLHCFWGVGVSVSPFIMGCCLGQAWGWSSAYLVVGVLQLALAALLLATLPLWRRVGSASALRNDLNSACTVGLKSALKLRGLKAVLICFFAYCGLESTAGLWASSYLVQVGALGSTYAASLASMFFIGITLGRFIGGFCTLQFSDRQLILAGIILILIGSGFLLIAPLSAYSGIVGLLLLGLGCAPVYPSLIHAVPDWFGRAHAQAVIGLQMASAYVGSCLMPPFFGLLAEGMGMSCYPIFLILLAVLMACMMSKLRAQ